MRPPCVGASPLPAPPSPPEVPLLLEAPPSPPEVPLPAEPALAGAPPLPSRPSSPGSSQHPATVRAVVMSKAALRQIGFREGRIR
ncbi:hypothetical protein [Sorangium sp. So ce854]|uniref:hypothetical protein n=1 Tax=Sorangium sp. So ce854 TaxID=3133322 RepID=UPI003F62C244